MDDADSIQPPVSASFHLAVLERAMTFLEQEVLSLASPDSFSAVEVRLVAEEAREAIRFLYRQSGRR